jgi:hypothetical protein
MHESAPVSLEFVRQCVRDALQCGRRITYTEEIVPVIPDQKKLKKICDVCGVLRDVEHFYKEQTEYTEVINTCDICLAPVVQKRKREKTCCRCKQTKDLDKYHYCSRNKDYRQNMCKKCYCAKRQKSNN